MRSGPHDALAAGLFGIGAGAGSDGGDGGDAAGADKFFQVRSAEIQGSRERDGFELPGQAMVRRIGQPLGAAAQSKSERSAAAEASSSSAGSGESSRLLIAMPPSIHDSRELQDRPPHSLPAQRSP